MLGQWKAYKEGGGWLVGEINVHQWGQRGAKMWYSSAFRKMALEEWDTVPCVVQGLVFQSLSEFSEVQWWQVGKDPEDVECSC